MITKNPMQLKAFIKNKAAEKHISAQLVMQNYMLERLLERISLSPYKNNFILKGGFLISAIVGLDTRATMDLDTTIKGFTLTHEAIRKILRQSVLYRLPMMCSLRLSEFLIYGKRMIIRHPGWAKSKLSADQCTADGGCYYGRHDNAP